MLHQYQNVKYKPGLYGEVPTPDVFICCSLNMVVVFSDQGSTSVLFDFLLSHGFLVRRVLNSSRVIGPVEICPYYCYFAVIKCPTCVFSRAVALQSTRALLIKRALTFGTTSPCPGLGKFIHNTLFPFQRTLHYIGI